MAEIQRKLSKVLNYIFHTYLKVKTDLKVKIISGLSWIYLSIGAGQVNLAKKLQTKNMDTQKVIQSVNLLPQR